MRLRLVDKGACYTVLPSVKLVHAVEISIERNQLNHVMFRPRRMTVIISQHSSAGLKVGHDCLAHTDGGNDHMFKDAFLAGFYSTSHALTSCLGGRAVFRHW